MKNKWINFRINGNQIGVRYEYRKRLEEELEKYLEST